MEIRHSCFRGIVGCIVAGAATASFSFAATPAPKANSADQKLFQQTAEKAVAFLQKSQNADGSYGAQKMPAIAAIN